MRFKRTALISLVLLIGLVGACGLWMHAQQKQYALNRQLIAALVKDDTKAALTLVDDGADPNTRYKPTPVPSLRQLWNHLLHHSNPPVNDSPTAFLIACGAAWSEDLTTEAMLKIRSDDAPLVQAMLKHGAKFNAKDKDGMTALMWAVFANHQNTAEVLLQHGADVNAKNRRGSTPLMYAAQSAAAPVLAHLLQRGADVNTKDMYGLTPLMYAAVRDAPDIVRLLLQHGADVNTKDIGGSTPLLYAAEINASPDVVRLLLVHGADVNAKDNGGQTPLMLAQGRPDIIALLRHAGARK